MVATILLSLLGCDATQSRPVVPLPPPTRLVSLHESMPGEGRRLPPRLSSPARALDDAQLDPGGYDISQYRLLGLLWTEGLPKALVSDPRGNTRILMVGSPLGRSNGRVHAIGAAGVELIEEYRASTGEIAVLSHTLTLTP